MLIAAEFYFFFDADFLTQTGGKTGRRPTSGPLLFHGRVKACLIHRHVQFPRHIGSQVHWETVGVVELKRNVSGQSISRHFAQFFLQQRHALIQSLTKAGFFIGQRLGDLVSPLLQQRVGFAHLFHQHRY